MRTETITKTYLQFNELSEKQQKKVIENFKQDVHNDMEFLSDDIFINYKELLSILGFNDVEIMYSGFYSQGDGACFTAKFDYPVNKKDILLGIKKANLDYILEDNKIKELFNEIELFNEENDFTVENITHNGRYYHEYSVSCYNNSLLELVREISRVIYNELYAQYEYIHSDEYIEESINCNSYEFDTDTLEIA